MTDEEMAEEYICKGKCTRLGDFLAGLKAGEAKAKEEYEKRITTRWHKVADGDLPKSCDYGTRTSQHVLARFKSGYVEICYFDFDLLGWFANGYPKQLRDVIAWCEIPKYTEVE